MALSEIHIDSKEALKAYMQKDYKKLVSVTKCMDAWLLGICIAKKKMV
ncbi:hypothetical protein [Helicobacter equorum]|nr:hypothetical protein [Helicobacter equorum]